jgi:hypothetical protein
MKRLGFKASIPAAQTILNARIRTVLKDPNNLFPKLLPPEGWSKTSDGVAWKDQPNSIQIILLPVTLTYRQMAADGSSSLRVNSFTAAELNEIRTRYEVVLKKLYPFGNGGIILNENFLNVQANWDLGTRSIDGKTYSGAQWFTDPLTQTSISMVPLVIRNYNDSGWDSVATNWDKLIMYGLAQAEIPYGLQYAIPGKFLCVLIKPVAGVTSAGTNGMSFPSDINVTSRSHLFAAFPGQAVDLAHELGHAHQVKHPFNSGSGWPLDPAYFSGTPRSEIFSTESRIGILGWDPFFLEDGSLNSGSVALPILGSLLYSPKDPQPYGLTKDLMDYINRNLNQHYWVSDYCFQKFFIYNTTNNPAP